NNVKDSISLLDTTIKTNICDGKTFLHCCIADRKKQQQTTSWFEYFHLSFDKDIAARAYSTFDSNKTFTFFIKRSVCWICHDNPQFCQCDLAIK
ncbi:hypothetical protein RFI_36799, partial [Reticulomyxa filosa]